MAAVAPIPIRYWIMGWLGPAIQVLAPLAFRPQRLAHPSPWLLLMGLWAVYFTQPPASGARLIADATDRRSGLLILAASTLVNLSAVVEFAARPTLQPSPFSANVLAGAALLVLGVGLRVWSIRVLGRQFTALVEADCAAPGGLVQRGPYAWVRHPSYSGVLLALGGVCLLFSSWAALVLTAVAMFPAYLYRVQIEEEVLTRRFGVEYRSYRHRTGRLFPKIRR